MGELPLLLGYFRPINLVLNISVPHYVTNKNKIIIDAYLFCSRTKIAPSPLEDFQILH